MNAKIIHNRDVNVSNLASSPKPQASFYNNLDPSIGGVKVTEPSKREDAIFDWSQVQKEILGGDKIKIRLIKLLWVYATNGLKDGPMFKSKLRNKRPASISALDKLWLP
mmetsp:Transcript_4666/g.7228  ORF Transcript_4666/g.7228 Transcript_4666/m.7228 type:complete len:109 (-) Transcript_4666:908-1234(-)